MAGSARVRKKGFTEWVRAAAEGEGRWGLWELGNATFPFFKAAHMSDGLPRTMAVEYMRYTYSGELVPCINLGRLPR